jgi:CHAD domain-containing protein
MPYKLINGRPLAQEVKRLFDQEMIAAATGLAPAPGSDGVGRLHDTRKHIKKARAILAVARVPLDQRYVEADDELRTASHALGPLADAHRALEMLASIQDEGILQLPRSTVTAMHAQLESRTLAIEKAASATDVYARTVRLLTSLAQDVAATDLLSLDRSAIVAEIRAAHAAARRARRHAIKRPSVDSFHGWRRRVKREWHLLRLVSALTGDRLRDQRHQLAALDACLGELHDVDVLTSAIPVNSSLSRVAVSRVVRVLRARAHELRHRARRLSTVLDERPRRLADRVRESWGSVPRRGVAGVRLWRYSA